MKLCGKEVFFPDTRNERNPIVREGRCPLAFFRPDIVGMDEVEEVPALNPLKERYISLLVDCVPTHMGDLMLLIGLEFDHLPFDEIQTFLETEFFTFREEDLEAKADAKIGLSFFDGSKKGFDQPKLFQISHAVLEGPHSREDNGRSPLNLLFIPGHFGLKPNPFETLLNVAKIPHPIIDDDNFTHLHLPAMSIGQSA